MYIIALLGNALVVYSRYRAAKLMLYACRRTAAWQLCTELSSTRHTSGTAVRSADVACELLQLQLWPGSDPTCESSTTQTVRSQDSCAT
jgi:hypothetical protein